ncbi:hypothetical protein PHYSODRAFT_340354 [Phytophthora sojae]|uniref:Uncharacterized protein n=1 Tax=Phytophthora sojae (strain P6497) TaxID=1094619 RepID=G5AB82_PHYSP|nr:hypothetical protein PHYSODRAFT_340354 [Phytophthora sojae]EGZ07227.1 hypothetical protein PHYSODRAFT_340354 [Phytophthora sojae]|eukprot:XP_009536793.1 hypothetical protein PHYSODRAFT_340354 [Phytophthora sojae]
MACVCRFLAKLWHATQVEMHGTHSTQRVLELTKYANETSWLRVVTILLVTPLSCLAVTVLVDILPLDDPFHGVKGNNLYFARSFYTFLVITFLATHQFRLTLCVLVHYGLAAVIGFPLPFSLMTVTPAWTTLVAISLAVEWAKKIRETPGAGKMVYNAIKLWLCEVLLVFTYLVYYYVFTTLSKKGKTAFALLLPVIKLVMKNIIARSVVHLIDEMPEVVVFNAEIFNALFVSYCMQNSPSIWITLEMMIFDALMMAFSLRDAGNSRRSLKELERRIETERSWGSFHSSTRRSSTRLTTLDRASMLLHYTVKSEVVSPPSVDDHKLAFLLPAAAKSNEATAKNFRSIVPISPKLLFGKVGAHPATNTGENPPIRYTRKVQQLVYAAEFLLLLNYVEVIIPLVYSIYLYVMYQLPNRGYYAQLQSLDRDHLIHTLQGVLFYCSLQLLSLFVLFFVLQFTLGLSPIHQLAFVLEKQYSGVQLKLVFWVYYNVQASLQYSGYDYSFKFAWLRQ